MGIVTVELALANLLYKYDWEMPVGMKKEDLDFDALPGIIMHKKNALCLVPKNYMGLLGVVCVLCLDSMVTARGCLLLFCFALLCFPVLCFVL
ncbi:hypothetical protein QYF36_007416 [Acer negundo]|nr:hypothetical protein QYF36_007416 [Acer negundo]